MRCIYETLTSQAMLAAASAIVAQADFCSHRWKYLPSCMSEKPFGDVAHARCNESIGRITAVDTLTGEEGILCV